MFSQHVQDTTSGRHVYEKGNTAGKQHRKALLSRIIDCLALKYSLDRAYVDDFIHEKVVYIRIKSFLESLGKGIPPSAPLVFYNVNREENSAKGDKPKGRKKRTKEMSDLMLADRSNDQIEGRVVVVYTVLKGGATKVEKQNEVKNPLYFCEFNASTAGCYLRDIFYTFKHLYADYFLSDGGAFSSRYYDHKRSFGADQRLVDTGSYQHIQDLIDAIHENQKYTLVRNPVSPDSGLPLQHSDDIVLFWSNKVHAFLNEKSNINATFRTNHDRGPRSEKFNWTVRKGHCENIINCTEQEEIIDIVLSCTNEKVKQSFIDTMELVKLEYIETCDNLKYLTSVEMAWQPLYQHDFNRCKDSFQRIINLISWMSTVSKFYGKPDRVAPVFEKISNQLVHFAKCNRPKAVATNLSGDTNQFQYKVLFSEENLEDYIAFFDKCIDMKKTFVAEFRKKKQSLQEHPTVPQFNFDEETTFCHILVFCSRIGTLREMFSHYRSIAKISKSLLHNVAPPIIGILAKSFVAIYTKCRNPFDHDLNGKGFESACGSFMNDIRACENKIETAIIDLVTKARSTSTALGILRRISVRLFLPEEHARKCLYSSYNVLLSQFEKEIQYVTDVYNEHKNSPPRQRGAPPVVGNILWARQLLRRLVSPMESLSTYSNQGQHGTPILTTDRGKKIVKTYNHVAVAISTFEDLWLHGWLETSSQSKSYLHNSLLKISADGRYVSNFSPAISRVAVESRMLKAVGCKLPEFSSFLIEQEPRIKSTSSLLDHVIQKYYHVLQLPTGSLESIFSTTFTPINKRLEECKTNFTWMSLGVNEHLRSVERSLHELETCILRANEILHIQIENGIRAVRNVQLFRFDRVGGKKQVSSVDMFVQKAESQIKTAVKTVSSRSIAVEAAFGRLFEVARPSILSKNVQQYSEAFDKVVQLYESKFTISLEHVIFGALRLLKDRIASKSGNAFVFLHAPLFKVHVHFKYPDIVLVPGLEKIQSAVNRVAKDCVFVAKNVRRWRVRSETMRTIGDPTAIPDHGGIQLSYFGYFGSHLVTVKLLLQLAGALMGLKDRVTKHIRSFSSYKVFWNLNETAYVDSILGKETETNLINQIVPQTVRDKLLVFSSDQQVRRFELEFNCLDYISDDISHIHPLVILESLAIDAASLKDNIQRELQRWKQALVKSLFGWASDGLLKLDFFLDEADNELALEINSLEELQQVMSTLSHLRELESTIDSEILPIEEAERVLSKVDLDVSRRLGINVHKTSKKWKEIRNDAEEKALGLSKVQADYKKQLLENVKEFRANIAEFEVQWSTRGPVCTNLHPRLAISRLIEFRAVFDRHVVKYNICNLGQKIFGVNYLKDSVFHTIGDQMAVISTLLELWINAHKVLDSYSNLSWDEFTPAALKRDVYLFQEQLSALHISAEQYHVHTVLSELLEEHSRKLGALFALKNDAILLRHWNMVERMFGVSFTRSGGITHVDYQWPLKDVISLDIDAKEESITLLVAAAEHERAIANRFDKIANKWRSEQLHFTSYDDRGLLLLDKSKSRVSLMEIEEHMLELNKILSNRHATQRTKDILRWINILSCIRDLLERWLLLQNEWKRLGSVFSISEIESSMPKELKRFNSLNKVWTRIVRSVTVNPNIVNVLYDDDAVRNNISYVQEQFGLCSQSLSSFLDIQRARFPRFYFITDAELLEVIGCKSNFERLDEYIGLIFSGMKKIMVTNDPMKLPVVTGLVSKRGELFSISDHHRILNENVHVVKILKCASLMMQYSLHENIYDAIRYGKETKEAQEGGLDNKTNELRGNEQHLSVGAQRCLTIIKSHNLQPALIALQVLWTHDCARVLRSKLESRKSGLYDLLKHMKTLTVGLIRECHSTKSPLIRDNITSVLLLQIYHRDVLADLCKKTSVGVKSFHWKIKLRYYWNDEASDSFEAVLNDNVEAAYTDKKNKHADDSDSPCRLKMLSGSQRYAYEYLGELSYVIVTPLTERCYVSILQGLTYYQIPTAIGPTGSGKTETIKSLASALGHNLKVINCSADMSAKDLKWAFSGMTSGGFWGLLDNFDRIKPTAMSVVAHYLSTIMEAIRFSEDILVYPDGMKASLHPGHAIFICLNPKALPPKGGLPSSVRNQLRPINLVHPDISVIARVKLVVGGFKTAISIGHKLTRLFEYCMTCAPIVEQSQFTIRSLNRLLEKSCATLLQQSNGKNKSDQSPNKELQLVVTLFYEHNYHMLSETAKRFVRGFVEDIFPSLSYSPVSFANHEILRVKQVGESIGYSPNTFWAQNVIALNTLAKSNHGFVILGLPRSGKSSILKTLCECSRQVWESRTPTVVVVHPQSIDGSRLFGGYNGGKWLDGVFTKILKRSTAICVQRGDPVWLVFDGCLENSWAEKISSLLDDNRKFTLANGICLSVPKDIKFVFETDSLNSASPATVSRVGMLNVCRSNDGEANNDFVINVVEQWLYDKTTNKQWFLNDLEDRQSTQRKREHAFYILGLFGSCLGAFYNTLGGLRLTEQEALVSSVHNVIALFDSLVRQTNYTEIPVFNDSMTVFWDKIFLFAVVWGVGHDLTERERTAFHKKLIMTPIKSHLEKNRLVRSKYWYSAADIDTVDHSLGSFEVPGSGSMNDNIYSYNLVFKGSSLEWVRWEHCFEGTPINSTGELGCLYIPTIKSESAITMLKHLSSVKRSTLLMGESGVGKSLIIKHFLNQNDKMPFVHIMLCASSTCQDVQNHIEHTLEKKTVNTFGTVSGELLYVVLNDMHAPEVGLSGDTGPSTAMSYIIDQGGLYSTSRTGEFSTYENILLIGQLPSKLLLKTVSRRFIGRTSSVTLLNQSDDEKVKIGEETVEQLANELNLNSKVFTGLAEATTAIWRYSSTKNPSSPSQPWLRWRLDDILFVLKSTITLSSYFESFDSEKMYVLWQHECERMFCDKVRSAEHKISIAKEVRFHLKSFFRSNYSSPPKNIIMLFGNAGVLSRIARIKSLSVFSKASRWIAFNDSKGATAALQSILSEHNEFSRSLTVFEDAMKHILHICRVIASRSCNALLLGRRSLGKKTSAIIAAFVMGISPVSYHVEDDEPREPVELFREVWEKAVLKNEKVAFIISDSTLCRNNADHENNVWKCVHLMITSLGSMEFFDRTDLEHFLDSNNELKKTGKTIDGIVETRLQNNVTFVLTMTRSYIQEQCIFARFPNVCRNLYITHYENWPSAALELVANSVLETAPNDGTSDEYDTVFYRLFLGPDTKKIKTFFCKTHASFVALQEQNMSTNLASTVSPSTFKRCLRNYKYQYCDLRRRTENDLLALENGLKKIEQTEGLVDQMEKEIILQDTNLKEKQSCISTLLTQMGSLSLEASDKKASFLRLHEMWEKQSEALNIISANIEEQMQCIIPIADKIAESLSRISPEDIKALCMLKTPPKIIANVLDAILILFRAELVSSKYSYETLENGTVLLKPSWRCAVAMMRNSKQFLARLNGFQKECIDQETIELLTPLLDRKGFDYNSAKRASGNVANLQLWVAAVMEFYHAFKLIKPMAEEARTKELALLVLQLQVQNAETESKIADKMLDKVSIASVNAQKEEFMGTRLLNQSIKRLGAAKRFLAHTIPARKDWAVNQTQLSDQLKCLMGDVAISSIFFVYMGDRGEETREKMFNVIREHIETCGVTSTSTGGAESVFLLISNLFSTTNLRNEWQRHGLSLDRHSVLNAILCMNPIRKKTPFIFDPQSTGIAWMEKQFSSYWQYVKTKGNEIISPVTDICFVDLDRRLEQAISNGIPIILSNLIPDIEQIDIVSDLLERKLVNRDGRLFFKMKSRLVEYNSKFLLYLASSVRDLSYPSDILRHISIINFQISPSAIGNALLDLVFCHDRPDLDEKHGILLQNILRDSVELTRLSERFLSALNNCKGVVIDNDEAVNTIMDTTKAIRDLQVQKCSSAETSQEIEKAREEYKPVASEGKSFFFFAQKLIRMNSSYILPYRHFIHYFKEGVVRAVDHKNLTNRVKCLCESVRYHLYKHVQRGLFSQHKRTALFLLALKMDIRAGRIEEAEVKSFFAQISKTKRLSSRPPKCNASWLTREKWGKLKSIGGLLNSNSMASVVAELKNNLYSHKWEKWFETDRVEDMNLPLSSDDMASSFWVKLVVIWCLRPERFVKLASVYAGVVLGGRFLALKCEDVNTAFQGNLIERSLLLVCKNRPGIGTEVISMAKNRRIPYSLLTIGEDQEANLTEKINAAISDGNWMIVENCQVDISILASIHNGFVQSAKNSFVHPRFRLWYCAEDGYDLPRAVIYTSLRCTFEPPETVRSSIENLHAAGGLINDAYFDINHPHWLDMLYALSYFHSVSMRRSHFGVAGFKTPYVVGKLELLSSIQCSQKMFEQLKKNQTVDWAGLRYTIVRVIYSGCSFDSNDLKIFDTLGQACFQENITFPSYEFYNAQTMPVRPKNIKDGAKIQEHYYRHIVETIPVHDAPSVFGLHNSVNRLRVANLGQPILSQIPMDESWVGSDSERFEISRTKHRKLSKSLNDYDTNEISAAIASLVFELGSITEFPNTFVQNPPLNKSESNQSAFIHLPLNFWLKEEFTVGKNLFGTISNDLKTVADYVSGAIWKRRDHDDGGAYMLDLVASIQNQTIPKKWRDIVSRFSQENLASVSLSRWISTFVAQINALVKYNAMEASGFRPSILWLGGLFLPRTFLATFMQEQVRITSKHWTLDDVCIRSVFTQHYEALKSVPQKREIDTNHIVYFSGLLLEGGRWEVDTLTAVGKLCYPDPKAFVSGDIPLVRIEVVHIQSQSQASSLNTFSCPVYQTTSRGESDKIMDIDLPLQAKDSAKKWILAGVALIARVHI